MSSKTKTMASKGGGKRALVPKLRFPEFRGAEGWKQKTLNAIADPVTERAIQGEENNVLSLSAEHGIVLQSEFFGKKVAGDNSERYLKIARNDFVYNDRTTKASTFGTIKRLSKHSGGIVSPIYKCFRFKGDENPVFWDWYFESGAHTKALAGLVNEGARTGRFNISITQFLSTGAWQPGKGEQKRIAECLSSADEVIAAQARKLDTLKTHKKGLMQQLFPREGETQPRLRFPEFQNAGEWASVPLGDLGEIVTGKTPSTKEADLWGGDILFITPTDISEDDKYQHTTARTVIETKSTKILPAGSVVYTCIASIGKMALTVHPSITNQQINAVVPNEKTLGEFIYYALANLTPWIKTLPATNTLPIINKTDFSKIAILLPEDKAEQQRIADCLTSLDNLIAAQTQTLEALKTHKQGLMQQLFPSPEEVAV